MTMTVLVAVAVLAVPVVLLFSATACAQLAGLELPEGPPDPPYGEVILGEKGLIGFWRLGEPEDAADAINSFPPGSYRGMYRTPNEFELQKVGVSKKDINSAAEFEGGLVQVPFEPPLTPPALTVELWLKVTDPNANADWRDVIGCYVANAADPNLIDKGYRIRVMTVDRHQQPRGVRIEAILGGMGNGLSRTVDLDVWHYVVLTYMKAKGAKLYIDQQPPLPAAGDKLVVLAKSDGQPLRFGGNRGDAPATFEGVLDEIALYGRALDEKDTETIKAHYKAAQP